MKFSDKLANLRKANNLSQEQLAEKLNVSRQSVSKWELGDTYPDMSKIIQMCKILNCKLPDLMDDGTFSDDYVQKEKSSNTVSSYLHNFLDYVTKTYNMFINMNFKSKITCLFEMFCIGAIIAILTVLFPDLLRNLFNKVFCYVPYGYTISSVLVDICTILLILLGVIVFFHLFKIRYLDYYVTVIDNTIEQQIVEEPISENNQSSLTNDDHNKIKMVIRDPKHSVSHFLDGIGKVLTFIFKIFVLLCAIPCLMITIGSIYFASIMLANASFSLIFIYCFIALAGSAVVGIILFIVAINYVFKRKQRYLLFVIIFICGLTLMGIGGGLATNKFLDIKIVDGFYNTKTEIKEIIIPSQDIKDGYRLEITTNNLDIEIDNSRQDILVQVEKPDYIYVRKDDFVNEVVMDGNSEDEWSTFGEGTMISFYSDQSIGEIFNNIKEDIKNGYFRQTYDNACSVVKVKVILSQETLDKIGPIGW